MWQDRLSDAVNANVRLTRVANWQAAANALIFGLENVIVIWLALRLVMNGAGFSVGMIVAYMAYKQQFVQKASTLIDQGINFGMITLHLDRLSDIALTEEDSSFADTAYAVTPYIPNTDPLVSAVPERMKGAIEVRNLSYRYSPNDPMVLENINLTIEAGEHVAITGPSGGGKSTLVRLLLGLAQPESGAILVDNIPMQKFGVQNYHSQISAVLQDDTLFAGTLLDNIALFDDEVNMELVVAAAAAASIHQDILAMPMRYETLVGDMGSALSGGQRQRILLARALYRRPRILVMDEGTAHLDAKHERAVNSAIQQMGITRIIIAHRKETIEAADRIITIQKGQLAADENMLQTVAA